jgi:hypothetical protein
LDSATRLRARLGGLARAARYSGVEVTAAARRAADERFRIQASRDAAARGEEVSEAELDRRARALRRLFYARLAFESAKVRARKKAG